MALWEVVCSLDFRCFCFVVIYLLVFKTVCVFQAGLIHCAADNSFKLLITLPLPPTDDCVCVVCVVLRFLFVCIGQALYLCIYLCICISETVSSNQG